MSLFLKCQKHRHLFPPQSLNARHSTLFLSLLLMFSVLPASEKKIPYNPGLCLALSKACLWASPLWPPTSSWRWCSFFSSKPFFYPFGCQDTSFPGSPSLSHLPRSFLHLSFPVTHTELSPWSEFVSLPDSSFGNLLCPPGCCDDYSWYSSPTNHWVCLITCPKMNLGLFSQLTFCVFFCMLVKDGFIFLSAVAKRPLLLSSRIPRLILQNKNKTQPWCF